MKLVSSAELLHNARATFLVFLFSFVSQFQWRPASWRSSMFLVQYYFTIKKQRSCRIASFRLFHTCFALILGHIESTLELPEEQHGFASVRRLEEHFVTATQVVDKTLSTKTPIWIIRLDLSKAFDGVDGKALCKSFHMVFLNIWDGFYKLHIIGSKFWAHPPWAFSLTGSVRQGCVLSPRLFNAVLLVGNVGLEKWEWFQFKQRFWHIIRFTVCWWG